MKHIYNKSLPDFSNTTIAFSSKSDKELQKAKWLFALMNKSWLVKIGSSIGLWAIKHKLPFVERIIKHTIFEQFCGGTNLDNCQPSIQRLAVQNVSTVLDYGAEAKNTEEDFKASLEEILRAIKFASKNNNVPVVSIKVTGLCAFDLLEKIQSKEVQTPSEKTAEQNIRARLSVIGQMAEDFKVAVFVDAEESWIQDAIDDLVITMMRQHNKKSAIIFNTFQMYRHDRLNFLKQSHQVALQQKYILGAKIVRGAYMEKERKRAEQKSYLSPIQKDKDATDRDYNLALEFCVKNHEFIASYNATHNLESNLLQAKLILERGIDKNHSHLNFCQLYGMSDQITYNLSDAGFNVMKYVPYGKIEDVIPYLIRRAQENTAVSGEMGREYHLIVEELKRRRG